MNNGAGLYRCLIVVHLKDRRASNKHVGAIGGKAEATPEIHTATCSGAHLGVAAILADAQDTAEQSWVMYFDLEDSGSYVVQDGELFREEPGGTYTPVGRVQKNKNF